MTPPRQIFFLVTALLLLIVVGWLVYSRTRVPKSGSEALNWAIEFQKVGRYDEGVEVLQTWLKGSNRDTSHDGFLYQQIAMMYIAKAYAKPTTRDQSIADAELNLEKSLDFLNNEKKQNGGLDSMVLEGVGGAYQVLGDMTDKSKCRYYEKARQALVRDLPLIHGDSYTAYGTTVPLEPVRAESRKQLDGVNEKYSKSGCRADGENQPNDPYPAH
ncbi:MAG TPA: hypothetical protein VMH48_03525 [Methylomirabilota bacterium]|nr:hypothetical protein [Methylomirabilota bacterium]